ncbi:N-6 DNA methylase [Oceanihabitans sp. 2_MG-2023]|uniref:Eco57I restriction-modification methylase domain-containing protein n=1 Tax=Oceanihabitans sp. 2_MG-2023 TaxID=3062661 RepID=UPI0026E23064|nr:N-6 DNA methylase [Oceanihabitans sp. 2_MG-2023]MDO6597383.1 N-6 DNA methylase [Oceanihabitans sp. 2_MG-2023]
MALFQTSVIKTYLAQQDNSVVERAYKKYTKYFHNATIQENIKNSKEEQYQAKFLDELFVNVLGYTLNPKPDFNITTEFKNQKGAGKADGAILKETKAIGVIELKGTNTKDLESIRKQAFDYKANQKGCVYVITSNFEKLRFYINDATEFLEFNLFQLAPEEFALMYLCLQKDNILNNLPLTIKEASLVEEDKITKQFYNDYSVFKRELFRDLVKRNAKRLKTEATKNVTSSDSQSESYREVEELKALEKNVKLSLFKKSQKLIDRFLFIFFAEDRDLLPPNSTIQILDKWKADIDFGDERPLYNLFKQYFHFLDEGRKGTTSRAEIYAYNGGLFKPDAILDSLEIDDDLLYKHTYKLAKYDFSSQVDVNILGHIFENSLNEIESVNAEIEGGEFDKQKSKRKKDGVFYTPKYITKYIVENTVGKLCQEKKDQLGFKEEAYFEIKKGTHQNTKKQLLEVLDNYRAWLLQITICDPACGSGAFLNQALDFLIKEHRYIDELKAKVLGGGLILSDIENTILENNIYGVDLNEESVEIAKLSLWLRTAQPRRKLNDLSNNIKCGNSLIDSKTVAGDKAFNWQQEFPQIFDKGGFDVIIGNPPYGADLSVQLDYLKNKYVSFSLSGESYILFVEKSIQLVKLDGRLGFIIPDTYLNLGFSQSIRSYILHNSVVENIVLLPANVFESATVDTTNLILKRKEPSTSAYINDVKINLVNKKSKMIEFDSLNKEIYVNTKLWVSEDSFLIQSDKDELKLLSKIDKATYKVEDIAEMFSGIKAYEVGKGTPRQTTEIRDKKPYTAILKKTKEWLPFYEGKHVTSYGLKWNQNSYISYGEWLAAPRDPNQFLGEKILIRKIIGARLIATYIPETSYCNTLLFVLKLKDKEIIDYKTLLGILNSKLIAWYFRHKFQISDDDTFPQIMIRDILKFPLIIPSNKNNLLNAVTNILMLNEQISKVVNNFKNFFISTFKSISLSKKLDNWQELDFADFIKELNKAIKKAGGTPLTKKDEFEWLELFEDNKKKAQKLQTQITQTEKTIDTLVYDLYGLTQEERSIIENS